MEENKDNDVIYDLENAEGAEMQSTQSSDGSKNAEDAERRSTQSTDGAGSAEEPDAVREGPPEEPEEAVGAEEAGPEGELNRLVEEMGAETVLDLIRDNRNAAIRQIIQEVEAARDSFIPSGTGGSVGCSSIFDLAALA